MLVFAEEVSIENDFKGTKKLKIFFLSYKLPLVGNMIFQTEGLEPLIICSYLN